MPACLSPFIYVRTIILFITGCGGIALFLCVIAVCVIDVFVTDLFCVCFASFRCVCFVFVRAEPEMEGLLCDLLWADPSDDPGVTNIEALSDQVCIRCTRYLVYGTLVLFCLFGGRRGGGEKGRVGDHGPSLQGYVTAYIIPCVANLAPFLVASPPPPTLLQAIIPTHTHAHTPCLPGWRGVIVSAWSECFGIWGE